MNKKEIKKKIEEKPSEEEVKETALKIAKEVPDYIDVLLEKNPRIGRAVQLYLTGTQSKSEIAALLGVTSTTVRKWFNDPAVQQYMEAFKKEQANMVRARIHASTDAALQKMVDLLESPIDGVALQAAKDLLDRAGHKPKQEVKKEVTVKTFEQQLADLIGNEAIDVDYEEVDDENDEDSEDDE